MSPKMKETLFVGAMTLLIYGSIAIFSKSSRHDRKIGKISLLMQILVVLGFTLIVMIGAYCSDD